MKDYVIGLDLGGTNIRAAAITKEGNILHRVKIPTGVPLGRERVIANILKVIDEIKKDLNHRYTRIYTDKSFKKHFLSVFICGKYFFKMVGARGFEPPTPCAQGRCASQTALRPELVYLF